MLLLWLRQMDNGTFPGCPVFYRIPSIGLVLYDLHIPRWAMMLPHGVGLIVKLSLRRWHMTALCERVMDPTSGMASDSVIVGQQLAAAYTSSAAADAVVGRGPVPGVSGFARVFSPREQNKVIDALAAMGRNGPIGVAIYEHPP
ncbi:hypothetical protein V6N12_027801 [Hibiscus sabdariffa]|uniref:Uncharacterized protein n=1 Tax=Hibiscus sabdariffa TaxID=183260 RepID=A0ABR2F3Y9_9ROSI